MPLYDYKCHACQARREVLLRIAELDSAVVHCLKCNNAMNRQLAAPMVRGDYPGYNCPITGKWVEGRRAHIENLAQHGCRILEPGETTAATRARQEADRRLESAIEETADRFIADLPTDKRDKLAAEMEHGLDVNITRQ